MRGRTTFLTAAILVGVAACGSDNGLNLASVSGKVTYKGEPIKNGMVMFEPDESKGNTGPQAIGTIKSDGTYILSSQDAGDGASSACTRSGSSGSTRSRPEAKALPSPEQDPLKYLQMKTQTDLKAASQSARGRGKDDHRPGREDLPGDPPREGRQHGDLRDHGRGLPRLQHVNIDITEDGTAKISN